MNDALNPLSTIDADAMSVRRTIFINAELNQVWRAITEPSLVAEWFGHLRLSGAGVGAHGTINWPNQPGVPIEIEAIEPYQSISYRWRNEPNEEHVKLTDANSTVFTFTLESSENGTELSVVEYGFENTPDPRDRMQGHKQGWDEKLDQIVVLSIWK